MPSSASATSSSNRSADTSTPRTLSTVAASGPLLTRCPQCDGRHPHIVHSVSTGVSTSYPEMSKVVETPLTVGLRIGKLTPPDAQCTARRSHRGEQHAERRAPGSGEPEAARGMEPSGGVVYGCVRDESRRRRRPPPGGSTKVGTVGGQGMPEAPERRKVRRKRRDVKRGAAPRSTDGFGRKATRGRTAFCPGSRPTCAFLCGSFPQHLGIVMRRSPAVHRPLPMVTASRTVTCDAAGDRRSSTTSTTTSAPRSRARAPRCASSPGPAPARPGCSPVASRTGSRRAPPTPATSSSSPSPARPPASSTVRLGALGCAAKRTAGTFHAVALAQLRQRWTDAGITPPSLLDRKAGLLAPLVSQATKRGGSSAVRAAGRRRGRDRVGEGTHDQPRCVRGRVRRRRPPSPATPHDRGVDLRALRAS